MKFLFLSGESFPNPYLSMDLIFNYYLPRRGLNPVWVMPGEVEGVEERSWRGYPLYLIPKLSSNELLYPLKLRGILRRVLSRIGRVSFVWVRDNPVMAREGYVFAKKMGIPFFYRISHLKEEESLLYAKMGIFGSRWRNYLRGRAGRILRNFLLRRADLAVAMSRKMEEYFLSWGIRKTAVLPEGIDGRVRPEDYPVEGFLRKYSLEGKKIVSYVGVLSPFRKSHFMLEVLSLLPQEFLLVIAGWGRPEDYPQKLLKMAREMGLRDRVRFLGLLPKDEVYFLIRASAVGLSPFPLNSVLVANSPIKPLEYLLMERPVVSTPVPDTVEVISLCGGGEICPWDARCFAEAVLSLAGREEKEARRKIIELRDLGKLAERLYEEILPFI